MLQIPDLGERTLVRAADAALAVASTIARPFIAPRRRASRTPRRILLLRLERIGDLVMALEAIRDVRALAPAAQIDLVVGSWNAAARARDARRRPRRDARRALAGARGRRARDAGALLRDAWRWRARRYDLAINFEPDMRSNLVAAAAGAARTAGWASGGGGPVLDVALDYDPTAHTTANARRLVAERLRPDAARVRAPAAGDPGDGGGRGRDAILRPGAGRPLVGVHVSGGRAIKQWDPGTVRGRGGAAGRCPRRGHRGHRRPRAIARSSAGCRPPWRRDW